MPNYQKVNQYMTSFKSQKEHKNDQKVPADLKVSWLPKSQPVHGYQKAKKNMKWPKGTAWPLIELSFW